MGYVVACFNFVLAVKYMLRSVIIGSKKSKPAHHSQGDCTLYLICNIILNYFHLVLHTPRDFWVYSTWNFRNYGHK